MTLEEIFERTPGVILQLKFQYDLVNKYSCTFSANDPYPDTGYKEVLSRKYLKSKHLESLLDEVYRELERFGLTEC